SLDRPARTPIAEIVDIAYIGHDVWEVRKTGPVVVNPISRRIDFKGLLQIDGAATGANSGDSSQGQIAKSPCHQGQASGSPKKSQCHLASSTKVDRAPAGEAHHRKHPATSKAKQTSRGRPLHLANHISNLGCLPRLRSVA